MKYVLAIRSLVLAVWTSLAWLPPLVARMAVGWVFVEAGWHKLGDLGKVVESFRKIGIGWPEFQGPLVAYCEFVCGVLLIAGLLTRVAVVPLIITMIVALSTAHSGQIHDIPDLFGMSPFLYIVLLVWLGAAGAGPVSVDWALARQIKKEAAAK